jgi:hypothetical protein
LPNQQLVGLSEQAGSLVQVDIGGVPCHSSPRKHGEQISLVQAVVNVLELVRVVVTHLARNITVKVVLGQGIVSAVHHVHGVRGKGEHSLGHVRGQSKSALGGVHFIHIGHESIRRNEGVHQTEQAVRRHRAIIEQGNIVAAINVCGGGSDQLDNVGVVSASVIPVVHFDVVVGIKVGRTQALLQQRNLANSETTKRMGTVSQSALAVVINRDSDTIAVIGEVIVILTLLAISPDLRDDLFPTGLRQQRGALAIQMDVNSGLLHSSGVAEETQAVDVTAQALVGGAVIARPSHLLVGIPNAVITFKGTGECLPNTQVIVNGITLVVLGRSLGNVSEPVLRSVSRMGGNHALRQTRRNDIVG